MSAISNRSGGKETKGGSLESQQATLDRFRRLPPIEQCDLVGLWRGRGIPSDHPLDGVLENLGWFGKRFTLEMRADALLFRSGERRLIAIDPSRIPLRLALHFHQFGRTRIARNLFSYLVRGLRANGPVASVRMLAFNGIASAAMIYDEQLIVDHFRRIDDKRLMGVMVMRHDDRQFFFELEHVDGST